MLVIWIFVVLVLTQCYAASLTSFLTIQQLKPPNTDSVLLELIKKGEKVAYQSHIVYEPLKKLGFADSQLWRHHTLEDARDLMSNGTVAAIIDEIPYNKLFLAKYCSNYGYYDIVDKRLRADGFAFVSPQSLTMFVLFFSQSSLFAVQSHRTFLQQIHELRRKFCAITLNRV